ncbi:hypothetical protein ETAA8_36970 [Anatilimnocola aggregata]|uniref:Uncharacterized protein n=1 Tax=Anatilimnocola aggregata TaxID=2528021 RepID=A0A517YEE7_9BACT|nr:hypothetical protein [Anatilimnocola aggregata]QDU28594.1 hypothetical protein ETAA8_36970 [Anatilimnocola aggregata]
MARRKGGEAGMNLDSLLDTLTNVVGVLVMVLMLTTLNVQSAVQRILDLDPSQLNVSAADLAKAQQQAEQLRKLREQLASKLPTVTTTEPSDNFGVLLAQIEALKKQKPAEIVPAEKLKETETKVDENEKKSKELATKLVATEEELARLKALLDKTEVVAAPPAKIVSLPNPRDAPAGATQYRIIVRDGQIVPFLPTEIRDRCKKQVELLLRQPAMKTKDGKIDCEKLVQTFNKNARVFDANFRVQLAVVNFNLYIVFELKPTGGESPKQATAASSNLRRGLKSLQTKHGDKFYIRFLVWNDSFDAYVAARSVCDEMGVLAGWEPYTVDYTWRESLGMTVPCEGQPPPPKPDPNAPAKPALPMGPTDTVD